MIESIGISLISTVISYLFKQNILDKSSIDIQGAPSWYGKRSNPNRIYVSTIQKGNIEDIDSAKQKVVKKMTLIIENGYKVTIKKYFTYGYSKKERLFINKIQKDHKLHNFVEHNIVFQNIKYDQKHKIFFIRGYMDKKILEAYQMKRVIEIKKKVLNYQLDNMIEELNKKTL